jgi:hypothetical protein
MNKILLMMMMVDFYSMISVVDENDDEDDYQFWMKILHELIVYEEYECVHCTFKIKNNYFKFILKLNNRTDSF